ncbi:16S rRNA (uracil(1498)-N(3))-methyltransferase [Leucobacter sp. wl10]|uniref:16S rRNA (uracil(1498)-N(3))-methyltransferase n=1 Tax=Leucobacter sp. wl10 TaxID=2304677 RepID=UPI000E5C27E7|nr:16S rRNA (uracil(1498)-N(3))-methyltransferase [Leucobacter sp. wl10]RGE22386.1 16S rRNA (uracil(1498)-N(3))-methyltransferase [Leucobacter sp. wl10]
MAGLYYREDLPDGAIVVGGLVAVTGEEARHAVRVSRLRAGERIAVGDGRGAVGEGVVNSAERDSFSVRIDAVRRDPEPARRLVLAQALAKGDRDERAVEQATEFGVDAVAPWSAARSVSRWDGGEKAARGVAKWGRIAREASKQSLRARIPDIREPLDLAGLCALAAREGVEALALHPRAGRRLTEWAMSERAGIARELVVVVGPEGGFADGELDALEAAGARTLALGETVLRTSSAGPAALAVLNAALGRW